MNTENIKHGQPCFACGGDTFRMFTQTKDYNWQIVPGPIKYIKCLSCGLIRQDPLPTPEQVSSFYPENYSVGGLSKTSCYRHKKTTRGEPNLSRLTALNSIASQPGSLLDIGCGSGGFMAFARDNGWQVSGLDPLPENATAAKTFYDIKTVSTGFWPDDAPEGMFDAITMFHLLEHLLDPLDGLIKAAEHLKGCMIMETPNIRSVPARIFGSRCTIFDAPRHIHLFSAETLSMLLERASLKLVALHTVSPTVMEYTESLRYLVSDMGLRKYNKQRDHAKHTETPQSKQAMQKTGKSVTDLIHTVEKGFFKGVAKVADYAGYGNSLLCVAGKKDSGA